MRKTLNFSKDYIVEKSLVDKYVRHLEYLEVKSKKRKEMRTKKKKEDATKGIEDYDWDVPRRKPKTVKSQGIGYVHKGEESLCSKEDAQKGKA